MTDRRPTPSQEATYNRGYAAGLKAAAAPSCSGCGTRRCENCGTPFARADTASAALVGEGMTDANAQPPEVMPYDADRERWLPSTRHGQITAGPGRDLIHDYLCPCMGSIHERAERLRAAARADTAALVEAERKQWLRHSPVWTDEEVGSVIDRIAAALEAPDD